MVVVEVGRRANGEVDMYSLLLTHLYQIVGVLLGCSFAGSGTAFPVYSGHSSLYEVHKYV